MTDMISSLADSIIALINASPRSPTKAEIEKVLHDAFVVAPMRGAIDAGMFGSFPGFLYTKSVQQSASTTELCPPHPVTDCQGEATQAIMPLPYKMPSWMVAAQMPIHPEATPKSILSCPGSTDGTHHWYPATSRIPSGAWRCTCGARKP